MRLTISLKLAATLAALALILTVLAGAPPAFAESPWWHLDTNVRPTPIPTGGEGSLVVRAANLGNAPTTAPATLTVALPPGTTAGKVSFFAFSLRVGYENEAGVPGVCKASASGASCSTAHLEELGILPSAMQPYEYIEMRVEVKDVSAGAGVEYQAGVTGGEAAPVTHRRALPIGESPPAFGAEEFSLVPEEEGGQVDTRAGSHPYQLTSVFNFNQNANQPAGGGTESYVNAPAMPHDLHFRLPPGQIGSATAVPQCTAVEFATTSSGKEENLCPANTAIGVATITLDEPANLGLSTYPVALFNLVPAPGEPARFGFEVLENPVILDTAVRSGPGEDYGVTINVNNITQIVNFLSSTVTFWGTPGDPSHDQSRGWNCLVGGHWRGEDGGPCQPLDEGKPSAFLTMPTNCAAPFATTVEGGSWTSPASPERQFFSPLSYSLEEAGQALALTNCNQLAFAPSISAEPTTDKASAPSGLDFNIDFHDEGLLNGGGVAQSQMKDTVVTLPEGFTINPSSGVGLGACTRADYAAETLESAPGAGCPNDSTLGTVEIETPLLTQKIHGTLFLAQPYENPFSEPSHPNGSLVAIYIVAKNPETGILIKLAGRVDRNPVTGQLTTVFENNPQLPFDHFNFHFREGAQAPLISPPACGTYATKAELTPWSEPTAILTETSAFTITKGYDGGACPSGGVPPFKPGIVSGVLNNNAGSFSPFYLHLTRTDGEQEISGFSTNLPAGLTGNLSGIPFCPEAAIEAARHKTGREEEANPSCPATSQIGHTLVGTGVGSVLAYVPGKIYLAGKFHGAPLSIVSITSAVVGPFDLGTVVLRFGLDIDPISARVNVSPTSSEPIPTIIDGIVTHVRDIRVYIDRSNFILNPTSCNPLSIASTLNAPSGASQTVTSPFQDSNCQALKFAPKFAVSTNGKTSRTQGASLHVHLTYPNGALGHYANIAKVKVDLPRQLPSRLTTLQKACTEAQFETNPAGCPAESRVGQAKAVTPLIPEPLEGPAYFVSHGGAKFPELVMVLQGYGFTIDLHGETFINKEGITSSTFETVPDQPIGSFELTLPQGKYSALGANKNLCTVKGGLKMPTAFVAQNGASIHQSTRVSVTGCPKAKAKKAKTGKAHKGTKKKK